MMIVKVSEENVRALRALREVIEVEEDRSVSLNQALSKVIEYYRRVVPL